ncbi:lysophospholipid acyltransferase family protein [Mucilaginibacter sp. X4EP1]|uniref:lysophospholipid acyltransferase family protein n=1 Tax=Mucilaginibacter sp. X4EP1 TaxID=2723092 RepID=UPI002166E85F|nr:1-acyl-sn-glycerol-3-phosphate acyltransferase [Mucilaginibacter sp. X4EP1]MCS3811757.1 1-acyl-sn-glycerol-3-phosphate acyltransferase [Mucilaginibacter sp. X4EP1]
MIIKAKPAPFIFIKWGSLLLIWFFRRRFNKMVLNDIDIKPNRSYLLMSNHFGFLDGFFAYYLCFKYLGKKQKIKGIYAMSVKKQMERNWFLKYFGSFSVEPGKRTVTESLDYAAEVLNTPGNILIYYPQGNLESSHIRHIEFKDGVYEIITRATGNCQLIWSSVLLEYFESTKPSAYITLLDCGTNHNFDFEVLKQNVNDHHQQAMKKLVRFTVE